MTTRIVGLTGSIGTGKSAVAHMLKRLRIPVHESDLLVHTLLNEHLPTIEQVCRHFPQAVAEGKINRQILGQIVFRDREALKCLEDILHHQIKAKHLAFIAQHQEMNTPLAVLDIPLLFEAGLQQICHEVAVTDCASETQRSRVLARPGMTLEKYHYIISQQWPPARKKAGATWVINTDTSFLDTFMQITKIMRSCT